MSTYEGKALNTITSAYWIYKGTASVEAINKATPKIGYTYTLTDTGKITNGNIDVVKGDVVCYLNGGWILVTEGNLGAVVTALNRQVQGIDEELEGTRNDLINRINNTDKKLADYKDEMVADQARQDGEISKRLTISAYNTDKTAQAQTDKAQNDAIVELQKHKQVNSDWNATSGVAQILNKPNLAKVATSGSYNDLTNKPTPVSPTSECVPYSADLDAISDDLGLAWMNVGEGRDFGHLYRKEQGGGGQVFWESFDFYVDGPGWMSAVIMRPYSYLEQDGKKYYQYTDPNEHGFSHGWYECFESEIISISGDEFEIRNHGQKVDEISNESSGQGGWKDVYDTSAITADITAEVQRATQAESALSDRISTKADASTWSANLKTQIDTDHTTLSGLSAKWTDILKSQIDADHTTLGTLNTYLSEAKRTSIDDAIAKAHQQNTDTALAVDKVVWNASENKMQVYGIIASAGNVVSNSGTHVLAQKLNSSMQQAFDNIEDLLANIDKIPEGAWCAIINTHSGGVSAQSDDDYLL